MKNFFNLEAPVFRFLTKVGSLILVSICWLVCSLPLVTVGAASAAMFRVCFDLREDKISGVFKPFFKAFAANFKLATPVWLIFVACFAVAYCIPQLAAALGMQIIAMIAIGGTCAVYLILWLMLVCVFPLIAYFDNTLAKTLRNTLLVAVKNRAQAIPSAVLAAIPLVLFLALPDIFLRTAAFWLLIYPGIVAYFMACRFAPVFLEYGNRRDENKEETA